MRALMGGQQGRDNELAERVPDNEYREGEPPALHDKQGTVESLVREAVALLYGDNFDSLVALFKQSGVEGFSHAVATAINTTLQSLEKQSPLSPDMAAAVGMKLFFMLLEDVVKGNLLPQLPVEVIKQGLAETISMYAKSHSDTVTPQDMQRLIAEIDQRGQGGMM